MAKNQKSPLELCTISKIYTVCTLCLGFVCTTVNANNYPNSIGRVEKKTRTNLNIVKGYFSSYDWINRTQRDKWYWFEIELRLLYSWSSNQSPCQKSPNNQAHTISALLSEYFQGSAIRIENPWILKWMGVTSWPFISSEHRRRSKFIVQILWSMLNVIKRNDWFICSNKEEIARSINVMSNWRLIYRIDFGLHFCFSHFDTSFLQLKHCNPLHLRAINDASHEFSI